MYSIADDDCGSRALCGDAVEMLCRQVGFSGARQLKPAGMNQIGDHSLRNSNSAAYDWLELAGRGR